MDSTSSRPLFVVDASVATKWHLQDEPWTKKAEAVLSAYRNGHIDLVAPGCIRYEVPSAIRKTLRTRRLTPNLARASIQAFLDLHLPTIDGDDLILAAYEITLRIGCSLYDGSYLALAEGLDCPLIHADLSLQNAVGAHAFSTVWLDDWPI
jgi:predicted nucleic acid-binding protein